MASVTRRADEFREPPRPQKCSTNEKNRIKRDAFSAEPHPLKHREQRHHRGPGTLGGTLFKLVSYHVNYWPQMEIHIPCFSSHSVMIKMDMNDFAHILHSTSQSFP